MTSGWKLAVGLLFMLTGFGAGWTANGWRLGEQAAEKDREHAAAVAAAAETARLKERAMTKKVEDARNEATKRETTVRRDAATARDSADGLRNELTELRRNLSSLAAEACHQRADTLAELFDQCQSDYRGLAEKADRHVNDVQTLNQGWPE